MLFPETIKNWILRTGTEILSIKVSYFTNTNERDSRKLQNLFKQLAVSLRTNEVTRFQ